jgi:hypothetical protein
LEFHPKLNVRRNLISSSLFQEEALSNLNPRHDVVIFRPTNVLKTACVSAVFKPVNVTS